MAITTYAELKTAITSWLDITAADVASQIDDIVTIGERRIFRETKTADTEAALSSVIASGVIAVPNDYIALKFAYINTAPIQILEARPAEWIYTNYPTRSADDTPLYIGREVSNFIFGPYPDSGYTVNGVYYKKLAALSSGVHALFTNNPDLYLFACLAESEILLGRDSRIPLWEAKYQKTLLDVNSFAKNSEYAGGNLRMRVG